MRKLLISLMLFACFCVSAQTYNTLEIDQELYKNSLDSIRQQLDNKYHFFELESQKIQVQNLGNLNFGMTKEEAFPLLRNKYGEPLDSEDPNIVIYKDKTYAGEDFNLVGFQFQSDGINSYLNKCMFAKLINDKNSGEKELKRLLKILDKRYKMFSIKDTYKINPKYEKDLNILDAYTGGISPLWNGHWASLRNELMCAVFLTIEKIEEDNIYYPEFKYIIKIEYGSYDYVKESF